MKLLTSSIAIYPNKYLNEMNISTIFPIDFSFSKGKLLLTGSNEYQVFLNGKLISYGPAKAAHKHHRVETIKINSKSNNNRLLIVVVGYNVYSYDRVNERPFVQYELYNDKNELCDFSNEDSECYLNESRIQKVVRFSIQRGFTESYNEKFNNDIYFYQANIPYLKLNVDKQDSGILIKKNVKSAKYKFINFDLKQSEKFIIDKNIKPYDISYMHIKDIGIFDNDNLDIDSNKISSQYKIKKVVKSTKMLRPYKSSTFGLNHSSTGFINVKIQVFEPCLMYVLFDEINTSENKDIIDFNFSRNTTNNTITYELNCGEYDLISFAPYTAKYIRVLLLKGKIKIKKVGIILLENPSINICFNFANKDIESIFSAAIRTFAANSVDILTDCPSRERAGWLCDSYFSGRSEFYFTGANKVETSFLENYADYKNGYVNLPKGMIPMCYPSDSWNGVYIPNWPMYYVLELKEYKQRTNNLKLINKSKRNVLGLINFYKKYENEFGLLENLESWVFVEWSKENDPDHIEGINIPTNMLYAAFLSAASELYDLPELKMHADNIKKWINENAFNGEFYIDNLIRENDKLIQTNHIGETTQYYAIYFDIANNDNREDLITKVIDEFGPFRNAETYYPHVYKSNMIVGDMFRLEILNRFGLYNKTIDESIELCSKMAHLTGTLWEHDDIKDSLNHCFGSCIAFYLIEAITGVNKIDFINKKVFMKETNYFDDYDISFSINKCDFAFTCKGKNKNVDIPNDFSIVHL